MSALEALRRIAELDPSTDSEEGFNEWGEADCFHQARKIARAALAAAEAQPAQTLTDEQLLDIASDFRSQYIHGGTTFDEFDELGFGRAVERALGIGGKA